MTFTLTTTLISLLALFTTLISAAPMGGGFGRPGMMGGPGPAMFNVAPPPPPPPPMPIYIPINNFAAYPYGFGFNQFNAFPYGMGFNRVAINKVHQNNIGGGCDECEKNKQIPIYVNNVPPPPPPGPAPVIYNEIPAPAPRPPPVVVNDIQSPPPQAPPTVINNVDPNQQPNLPPTVVNNVAPPPPKPMPPMVVENNVADDCECDECGCNGGGSSTSQNVVQNDVQYVPVPIDGNFGGQSVAFP